MNTQKKMIKAMEMDLIKMMVDTNFMTINMVINDVVAKDVNYMKKMCLMMEMMVDIQDELKKE